MENLNTESVFFEALQLPLYAIPEFFRKKQQESGWSRDTYLKSLTNVYNRYLLEWNLSKKQAIAKDAKTDLDTIGRPLTEITGGKVKEAYTLSHNLTTVLNEELLDTLYTCIQRARTLNNPKPVYSNIQITSFTERALSFILTELEIQCGKIEANPFSRTYPKGFKSHNENKEPNYLLHEYSLAQPAPVFDKYLFQDALRNLLLESRHPNNLKHITERLVKVSKEIIEIWNKEVFPLESIEQPDRVYRSWRFIRFDTTERKFVVYAEKLAEFNQEANKHFYNYDLVVYASQVGNITAFETSGTDVKESEVKSIRNFPPSKLLFLFLYKRDKKLNKTKYLSSVKTLTGRKEKSLDNDYRELEYFINGNYEKLKEGEKATWEGYNNQLNNRETIEELMKLNI